MVYKMQILMRILLVFTLTILTAACVTYTPYQKATATSFTGGYSDKPAANGFTKVSFAGNGYLSAGLAQRYVLLRAAQLGQQKSKRYFSLYTSLEDAVKGRKSQMPITVQQFNTQSAYAYVKYHQHYTKGDMSVKQTYNNYKQFLHYHG